MSLNLFIVQLAFVFLPGLLWARVNRAFVSKREVTTVVFFVNAFFYGLISYALTFLLYSLFRRPFELFSLATANAKLAITPHIAEEVIAALVVAVVGNILGMYASSGRWTVRLFQRIGATKRFGYEDIWDYTFNTNTAQVEYVYVRDFEKQLVFAGWVRAFSESERARELLLRDVRVTNFDGEFQYEVAMMYIASEANAIHIEFPVRDGDQA